MRSLLKQSLRTWHHLTRPRLMMSTMKLHRNRLLFGHHNYRYFSTETNNNNKYENIRNELISILRRIDHPSDTNKDIVYLGLIKNIRISEKEKNSNNYIISIDLELDRNYRELKKLITDRISNDMKDINIDSIRINMAEKRDITKSTDNVLKNVQNIIAVSSCKGGVGKSSISVNLAYTLSKMDHSVGIFDADIYGPSLPTLTAANLNNPIGLQQNAETQLIYPIIYEGVKLQSFGYVHPSSTSGVTSSGLAAMRGPMVSNVIQQLLFQTDWGYLDYLIIDFPPGTSDIHLTLTQKLNINASIVITTPQLLSLIDVIKGIEMFKKVQVPTIALIKNMTHYICKQCGSKQDIFSNQTKKINQYDFKKDFDINNIYEIPIYPLISEFCDYGDPIVLNNDSVINPIFDQIANDVIIELEKIKQHQIQNQYQWQIDKTNNKIKFVNQNKQQFEIKFIDLRFICKCALCIDEITNQQILKKEDIDENIEINYIEQCGNYAVRIVWSDKHESIYSFDVIKSECV